MKRLQLTFICIVVLILASATLPVMAQGGPQPVGIRLDAPPYAKHGPFWVGEREFTFMNGDRKIEVAVWYPALNPVGIPESITYRYDIPAIGGVAEIPGRAIGNALPDVKGGPYPLVLFSHGFGMYTFNAPMFTEHWASYGFVVIALNHPGSDLRAWFGDFEAAVGNFGKSAFNRFNDVLKAIPFAETLTAKEGDLAGMIDVNNIAVAGHSFGAFTSMVMGGARLDVDGFAAMCGNPEVIGKLTAVGLAGICAEPVLNDFYTLSGVKPGSKSLAPAYYDPRVKAVMPMATLSGFFTPAALAEMKTAVMLFNGTGDLSTPAEYGAIPIYKDLSVALKANVLFREAGHNIFRYDCNNVLDRAWGAASFAYCSDPVWEFARAHDLTNHFTTAFLLDVLKGDAEAHKALLPEAVTFPGVTYETTLK